MQLEANKPAFILNREQQADKHGIIYAAMAGFDPLAIVTEGDRDNFFTDWARAVDPGFSHGQLHVTMKNRATELKKRLRKVADQTAAFKAGLWWYYAGDYPQAIQALQYFPIPSPKGM